MGNAQTLQTHHPEFKVSSPRLTRHSDLVGIQYQGCRTLVPKPGESCASGGGLVALPRPACTSRPAAVEMQSIQLGTHGGSRYKIRYSKAVSYHCVGHRLRCRQRTTRWKKGRIRMYFDWRLLAKEKLKVGSLEVGHPV